MEFKGERSRFTGFTRLEYHWAEYRAGADWNLRDDFQHPTSYTHEADGRGFILAFGGEMEFSKDWNFGLSAKYQDWKAEAGLDRTYRVNGTIGDTQLNEVKWRSLGSLGAMLTGTRHFSLGKPKPRENYTELK